MAIALKCLKDPNRYVRLPAAVRLALERRAERQQAAIREIRLRDLLEQLNASVVARLQAIQESSSILLREGDTLTGQERLNYTQQIHENAVRAIQLFGQPSSA